MLKSICKPEYLFQPTRIWNRIWKRKVHGKVRVELPWGHGLTVSVDDNIGSQIDLLGVYDLVLTEALFRLTDRGETVFDVGANIGYATSVLSACVGEGTVFAFEPHPVLFRELSDNIACIREDGFVGQISVHECAIGSMQGSLPLFVPMDFAQHRGESSLAANRDLQTGESVVVKVRTLDELAMEHSVDRIGVMKIDVEGFELEVLKGGNQLLKQHRIRDIVFEDHGQYPTDVSSWLSEKGFQIFRLERSLVKPILLNPSNQSHTTWTAPNYLATIDPDRAKARFSKMGWICLRRQGSTLRSAAKLD